MPPPLLKYATPLALLGTATAYAVTQYRVGSRLELLYDRTCPKLSWLVKRCPALTTAPYQPPLWSTIDDTGNLHTIVGYYLRKQLPHIPYVRELLRLQDGGTVGLDWAERRAEGGESSTMASVVEAQDGVPEPAPSDSSTPVLIIMHGLNGDANTHYIRSLVSKVHERTRWRVVVMVARGCGGVALSTPESFTAARTQDFREALAEVHRRYPHSPKLAVGFSLGGALLGKFLGEEGEQCTLEGAAMICPPWNFLLPTATFELWGRAFFVPNLLKYVEANRGQLQGPHSRLDLDKVMQARTVREFDHHAVVPVHGYKDVDDYYADSSPDKLAHRIAVPTLAMCARDDPVCHVQAARDIPRHGPGLVLCISGTGGHLQHVEGLQGTSYQDRAAIDWLQACLHHSAS